eukprot:scaffold24501_cov78-Skeletonema_dohrnii-CCMP3373.AAC.2
MSSCLVGRWKGSDSKIRKLGKPNRWEIACSDIHTIDDNGISPDSVTKGIPEIVAIAITTVAVVADFSGVHATS